MKVLKFKKEIKEVAQIITREEFLKEVTVDCPSYYDLNYDKNICNSSTTGCKSCWESAIKDFKFKDEEVIENHKEYTIHSLLNDFEEGIEFIKVSDGTNPLKYKILNSNLYFYNYVDEIWEKTLYNLKVILNIKFTKVEEPKKLKSMTLEEAIKIGNKIKFKYSDNYNMMKGFLPFNDAIYFLTTPYFDNNVIRKLILEGTWFAEGVYE